MRLLSAQSAPSDPSLCRSTRSPDESTSEDYTRFNSVVMPHLDAAYNLAYWLTGTDAEDVVQEASLRAFRAVRVFAGGSARAWVLRIVRNTAYSWLRKNRSKSCSRR